MPVHGPVLHVTSWYPSEKDPGSGIFVRRHIESLGEHTGSAQFVWHLDPRPSERLFRARVDARDHRRVTVRLESRLFKYFRLQALANLVVLVLLLVRHRRPLRDCLVMNVHIAPLLLVYVRVLRALFPRFHVVVAEHWTGYHRHFGLSPDSTRLRPIRRLFAHVDGVITVSRALADDIVDFVGTAPPSIAVVPNVVEAEFTHDPTVPRRPFLFMLANWNEVKEPEPVIRAFARVVDDHPDMTLVIGGDGERCVAMRALCESLGLLDSVSFPGWMRPRAVAEQMQASLRFLHNADYETFSVVTAEALCCGTPVVVRALPAIAEFVDDDCGIFVPSGDVDAWHRGIMRSLSRSYDHRQISERSRQAFSRSEVGRAYAEALDRFVAGNR